MLKWMIGIILISWTIALSGAGAVGLEFAVGGWQQDPNGTFSFNPLSPTDLLNVDNDLRYDNEIQVQGRVKIDLPLLFPNIYLVAVPAEFEETGRKSTAFKFGDTTFTGNVDFFSKLRFNQYDIALYYGLPFLKTATADTLNVDLGINIRIFDALTQVRQGAVVEEASAVAAIPQIYVAVQLTPVKRLAFEAESRFMSFRDNTIHSLVGRVRLNISGPVFIAGGYRYDNIDIDEGDVRVDFELQGPFAEVGFKF